jgi:hypothetical protein
MRRNIIFVLIGAAAIVSVGVVARGSDAPDEPGFAKGRTAPASFGVAGPDGEPVVCANGKQLRVSTAELLGPPNLTPDAASREMLLTPKRGEERFWRCGTGANPDVNARLVPASEDPLNAPGGRSP